MPSPAARADGQASAELVALLPLVAVVLALGWQVVLAGHATWAAGAAARAAARAHSVGQDARAAARRRLPDRLDRGVRVAAGADGAVRVSVRIPSLVASLDLGRVSAEAMQASQKS